MNHVLIALNRFGLGARIGEAKRLRNPRQWLEEQLHSEKALLDASKAPSMTEISGAVNSQRMAARSQNREELQSARRSIRGLLRREATLQLEHRNFTETPFLERLVAFWSNHLCVSIKAKPALIALAGHYEREAIRPHILGPFSDLVLASAKHPAMLIYLDNVQSIGPSSTAARALARRRGRERGLNENYARELLELHTVGVDGGYQQKDVEELAKILTGWTVAGIGPRARRSNQTEFGFNRFLHEPGSKTVLGVRYREAGIREGETALRDICRRPETAHFLAGKLARHFVSDSPSRESIDRLAKVYLESDGNLLKISRELIHLEEAWDPAKRKFRTPQDWLTAGMRALGIRRVAPRLIQALGQLRHPIWAPDSPKGFADDMKSWSDPDSLMNRAELARTISQAMRRRLPKAQDLAETVYPPDAALLRSQLSDTTLSEMDRAALALAGPAFQWR